MVTADELYVCQVYALPIGHGNINILRFVARLLKAEGVGAALDGTVEVAHLVGAHL